MHLRTAHLDTEADTPIPQSLYDEIVAGLLQAIADASAAQGPAWEVL